MTLKLPTSNLRNGDRLVSPTEKALLQVVAERNGDPIVVDLLEVGTGDEGEAFEAHGYLTDEDLLNAGGFYKVFEIEAKPGDIVVAHVGPDNFRLGRVVFTTPRVLTVNTFAPEGITDVQQILGGAGDNYALERNQVFVILPVPHTIDWTPEADDLFVVVNPNLKGTYGDVVMALDIDPATGHVRAIGPDGARGSYHAGALSRYTRVEQLHVIDIENEVNEEPFAPLDQNAEQEDILPGLFEADYVPAAQALGMIVDFDDSVDLVGMLFSAEEIQVMARFEEMDKELPTNMIGILLNKGRVYEDAWLRTTLNGSFSDGFADYIPDATEFFKLVGKIAADQAKEKVKRTIAYVEAVTSGASAGAVTPPDLDMVTPVELAFNQVTGFDPDLTAAFFNEDLSDNDIKVLKEAFADSIAQRAVEGGKVGSIEEAEVLAGVTEMLDAMFGKGNYTLVPESELDDILAAVDDETAISDVFPTPPMPTPTDEPTNVFEEAQKIADAIGGETHEPVPAPEADVYSEVASVFGVTRDQAKRAVYEALYGGRTIQEVLVDVAKAQATLTEIQEAIQIAKGDLRTAIHFASEVVDGLDAVNEDIHTLRGIFPKV